MKGQISGPALSAVFVDYDNIYLSLKRKNDEAAKRFAKDSGLWLSEIASGRLITPTNSLGPINQRRVVMSRCYGNPVPRRNNHDNSTDMNSFPFVRHHFLRAGFEAIDCPPLTAQLKNSADIRMVMDIRDFLLHDTYFDEFVILSGDADFTPVLHRLRAHARRTVIFANDNTAAPYTAIADGEIRESSLLTLLLEGRIASEAEPNSAALARSSADIEAWGRDIIAEVVETVRGAGQPVPLEALADRAVRVLGHERTAGSGWGGAGTFRELLLKGLPQGFRLNPEPPYYVIDTSRQIAAPVQTIREEPVEVRAETREPTPVMLQPVAPQAPALQPVPQQAMQPQAPIQQPVPQQQPLPQAAVAQHQAPVQHVPQPLPQQAPQSYAPQAPLPHTNAQQAFLQQVQQAPARQAPASHQPVQHAPIHQAPVQQPAQAAPQRQPVYEPAPQHRQPAPAHAQQAPARPQTSEAPAQIQQTQMQQSIARIYEACQAPPLSPPEYRALFDCMAQEITANGLTGAQTLTNIAARAKELGVEVRRDDVRFVLEVVSEADPWFEQGASTALFASRFRNFVVARCRGQGLNLSLEELDLIESWFSLPGNGQRAQAPAYARAPQAPAPSQPQPAPQPVQQRPAPQPVAQQQPVQQQGGDRWWNLDEARREMAETRSAMDEPEEFPRIVKNRLRG
jgi:hypothetical protein